MSRILNFTNRCHGFQLLLPWYVSGKLDQAEHARVDAHLAGCADCRAQIAHERDLMQAFQVLPVDEEMGWTALRDRIVRQPRRRSSLGGLAAAWQGVAGEWSRAGAMLRWTMAVQLGLLFVLGALALPHVPAASYHALGLSTSAQVGDIVVVFKPETTEAGLRAILKASGARVVDGPTSTDAFLLHVPLTRRPMALARLRGASQVVLAEPVDAGGSP
jgi:predicted anti-sigma-YlaC factor YlaD